MKDPNDFLIRIVGLGGQGVLSLSNVIANAAAAMDLDFTALNRLRSAMRLGPVICDMRIGKKGFYPTIPSNRADAILGLEPMEGAASAAQLIRPGGFVLINSARIPPVTSIFTGNPYPNLEPIWVKLREHGANLIFVDASAKAKAITGKAEGANFFLLGMLVSLVKGFPLSASSLEQMIADDPAKLGCFRQGSIMQA